MSVNDLSHYRYRGARALVIMHERYLRECYETWKQAKAANVQLPKTDDPNFQSLSHLLFHLLRASRGYMVWMCEQLQLPEPQIRPTPVPEKVESEADQYLEHLLEKWREPLAEVDEEHFYEPAYKSRWGSLYCLDGMLEHAVTHPLRHAFQLRELMETQAK